MLRLGLVLVVCAVAAPAMAGSYKADIRACIASEVARTGIKMSKREAADNFTEICQGAVTFNRCVASGVDGKKCYTLANPPA